MIARPTSQEALGEQRAELTASLSCSQDLGRVTGAVVHTGYSSEFACG